MASDTKGVSTSSTTKGACASSATKGVRGLRHQELVMAIASPVLLASRRTKGAWWEGPRERGAGREIERLGWPRRGMGE
jgi:hypothetical protein